MPNEFKTLVDRFAHTEKHAAAKFHTLLADKLTGIETFGPRMRSHDVFKERFGGLKIVVVAMHANVGETLCLRFGHNARTHGNVETDFVLHKRNKFADAIHRALIWATNGQHDAKLGGAERSGFASSSENVGGIEERHRLNRRFELRRLTAEVTILGTATGLGRKNAFDLDGVSAPFEAHLVGE
ncbi:unannotated protein [freshwater metagenome]|uniref:Unannotated protein n=1 Tax=freshwater metagenome TaxID=449393 RepID=A0A6J6JGU3_9ZZZZ